MKEFGKRNYPIRINGIVIDYLKTSAKMCKLNLYKKARMKEARFFKTKITRKDFCCHFKTLLLVSWLGIEAKKWKN